MRLIRQIETALAAYANSGGADADMPGWGYGLAEYDIEQKNGGRP